MARVAINTGASANDGLGDNLRSAGGILNSNFLELYTYLGAGSTTVLSAPLWSSTNAGINTLSNVGIGTTNPRFALEVGAVGASGTTLFVNGDARVTGIVTIGPASITLNGITNIINVGTGITINGSTGIISATAIVVGGTTLTGAGVTFITAGSGISVNQSTGNVTITATGTGSTSQWVTTAAGIHTLSNVGIGTTNPTSALTVTGNGTFTGVVTATTFIGALTGTATTATNAQGLTGTPNITVGVATASTLNVGTSGTVITTTTAGLVGIGTTNPTSALTVGAVGSATTNLVVNGFAKIDQIVIKNNSNSYQDNIIMTQHPAVTFTGNRNVAIGDYSFTTPGAAGENVAIGYYALNVLGNNDIYNIYSGNTALGCFSGQSSTYTLRNTLIGYKSGQFITIGDTNTILGAFDGNQNGLDIRTSDGNVVLSDGDGNIRFYANSSGNVGLGTTNPTSALTVKGNTSLETLNVTGVSTFGGNINVSEKNIIFGLSSGSSDDRIVWGASSAEIYTNTTNLFLKTNLTSLNLQSDIISITNYAGDEVLINASNGGSVDLYYNNSKKLETTGTGITVTGTIFTNQLNVSGVATASTLNIGTGGTVITTTTAGLVGIGTTNPTKKLTVSGDALINGLTVGLGSGAVTSNTAIGASALYSNTSGNQNTAIGVIALFNNTGGVNNTANGYAALYSNTNGDGNTATGHNALLTNTTGDFNTANGAGTLSVNTGEQNTATGYGALNANTTGNFNTAIGVIALGTITTGTNNTGIGASAGIAITTGSKNTLLGSYTGNQNGLDIRTSSNNVVLSDGDGNIRFYANSSGNVGLGTTNPIEKLTVVGVTSSTSFYGDSSYTASGRWTLGANGFSDYTFVGIGFTQTTNDPVLYLARGRVYEFVNNSGGSHPFEIRLSNGGAAYSDGVTNNGGASGVIRFEIPFSAPNTLYYQCTSHSGMGNTISVYPNTI